MTTALENREGVYDMTGNWLCLCACGLPDGRCHL